MTDLNPLLFKTLAYITLVIDSWLSIYTAGWSGTTSGLSQLCFYNSKNHYKYLLLSTELSTVTAAPKSSLLCSKLCLAINIVKFNLYAIKDWDSCFEFSHPPSTLRPLCQMYHFNCIHCIWENYHQNLTYTFTVSVPVCKVCWLCTKRFASYYTGMYIMLQQCLFW